MLRVGVLISGRGSNLKALLKDAQQPDAVSTISCVLSSSQKAAGLELAAEAGVPHTFLSPKDYGSREAYDAAVAQVMRDHDVDLICLAGFMRILDAPFVNEWYGKLINIHPSLLPSFKGLHVHEQVIDAGVRITGCTVHFVSPEMDEGPIIAQAAVRVQAGDTPDAIAARVLTCEHQLYPSVVRAIAQGDVKLDGNAVQYSGDAVAAKLSLQAGF